MNLDLCPRCFGVRVNRTGTVSLPALGSPPPEKVTPLLRYLRRALEEIGVEILNEALVRAKVVVWLR
jgi:hypothetical protein